MTSSVIYSQLTEYWSLPEKKLLKDKMMHFFKSPWFNNVGPGGSMSWVVKLPNNSYKPITNTRGLAPRFVNDKKVCTRLAAASDKVYQLLTHGRWFSTGAPASSTTKTGRHDRAEILLKVVLNTKNQINHWFNAATLWIVWIKTATSSIAYKLLNRNSTRGSGCVHVVLSRGGKLVMAKLKSLLS